MNLSLNMLFSCNLIGSLLVEGSQGVFVMAGVSYEMTVRVSLMNDSI